MAKGAHGGRPSSWLAVGIMITGFVIGGISLTVGPAWPMFWTGVVVAAVGGILALSFDIFSDVVTDDARVMPEGVGQQLVHRPAASDSEPSSD
jgi:hypothetical protein